MAYARPVPAVSSPATAYTKPAATRVRTADAETTEAATAPAVGSKAAARPQTSVTAGSVKGADVTVHRVRLGPNVREIRVAKSAGVQVGNHNRQLNRYQFRIDRPRVSLDHLLTEHPATLRAFERLVANPRSWVANYSFRHHLPTGPTAAGRGVLFTDASRPPTTRLSAHVDEHGATVVENSRGVQVGDHNRMRNDFRYKLTGQEISLGGLLRDRPDLARTLAMTIRYPGNPAVQRSFTRQFSDAYAHGGTSSLSILNQDLPGANLSVDRGVGVQIGAGNSRTDRISVDIRRLALTGWDSIASAIDKPVAQAIDGPGDVAKPAARPAARLALAIRRLAPSERRPPDPVDDPGPGISPFSL